MLKQIIQKVWKNKTNGQKAVTIPKSSNIEEGDYVQISKIQKELQGSESSEPDALNIELEKLKNKKKEVEQKWKQNNQL